MLHALKHSGGSDDSPGAPAHHAQVCLDCVSFAPLAAPHGGAALVLFVATVALWAFSRSVERTPLARRPQPAFRSRAPPRR